MVDGKLKEPQNKQVTLIDMDKGVVIDSCNKDSAFLDVQADPDTDAELMEWTGSGGAQSSR